MISDGLPHKVMLDHNAGSGTINVDGVSESYVTPGSDNQLNLDGSLHIGGIYQEDHLPSQMWTSGLDYGYVGCLQDLVMNGDKIDLAGIARDQDTPGVEEYCRVMGNQCPSAPCMHRGTCTEGWNRFVCDCTQTPYTGAMCNQGKTICILIPLQIHKICNYYLLLISTTVGKTIVTHRFGVKNDRNLKSTP